MLPILKFHQGTTCERSIYCCSCQMLIVLCDMQEAHETEDGVQAAVAGLKLAAAVAYQSLTRPGGLQYSRMQRLPAGVAAKVSATFLTAISSHSTYRRLGIAPYIENCMPVSRRCTAASSDSLSKHLQHVLITLQAYMACASTCTFIGSAASWPCTLSSPYSVLHGSA